MAKEHKVITKDSVIDFVAALDAASLDGWEVIAFADVPETDLVYGYNSALLARDKKE